MMTIKEKEITNEMLDLIGRIKTKTDGINTDNRIPGLELDVILSKIEQLHQKAIVLKYLHNNMDEIIANNMEVRSTQKSENHDEGKSTGKDSSAYVETAENPGNADHSDWQNIKKDSHHPGKVGTKHSSANDSFSTEEDGSLAKKLQKQPIKDIKSAIGINDKFQFIKQLFNGENDKYEKTVKLLNEVNSLEEARKIMDAYNWDKKDPVVQLFTNIVSRRVIE